MKYSNRDYLKYIPIYITLILIFKFFYANDGLSKILGIFIPVLVGIFIAIIINPMMTFLENKILRKRVLAMITSYFIFFSLITVVAIIVIPQIGRSLNQLVTDIPKLFKAIGNFLENPPDRILFIQAPQIYDFYKSNIPLMTEKINDFSSTLFNRTLITVTHVFTTFFNFIMSIVISVYILWEKEYFQNLYCKFIYSIFDENLSKKIIHIGNELNNNVVKFINGKIVDSFIIGVISFLAMKYMIRIEYSLLFAIIIGFTNMIPYFGPIIGGIPVSIMALLFDPIKGVWVIIFVILIQQFDGLLLGPKIIGIQLALRPLWVIAAIIIGGGFFGFAGMFFATPVAALIKTLVNSYMDIKLESKNIELSKKDYK